MEQKEINSAIMSLKEDVSALRTDIKAAFKRIDEQREQHAAVHETNKAVVRMETKLDHVLDKLGDHESRIIALENKPARLWDTLISSGIGAVIGYVAGMIFKR